MFLRLGRFCARRRWVVIAAWVVVFLLGIGIGGQVFNRLDNGGGSTALEAVRGSILLDDHGTTGEEIIGLIDGKPVDDPALTAAARTALADVAALPHVAEVQSWYTTPDPRLKSADGSASAVRVVLEPMKNGNADATDAVRDRLHALGQQTGARVLVGGNRLLRAQINDTVQSDLQRGELVSLVVVAIALFFVFGGFLASFLPLIAALVAISGTLLLLLLYSTFGTLDSNVITVVTTLALGLAIDYALLMVNRFREERLAGLDTGDAIARCTATAGRSVAFSAVTIAAAMSGLYVFASPTYSAIGTAGIGVALVALLAAVTLVPALLAVFGRRIKLPSHATRDVGFFSRITEWSQRRPFLVIAGVAAVLLAVGSPFFHLQLADNGVKLLPKSFETRQVAEAQARFGGPSTETATIAAEVAPTDPRVASYLGHLAARTDVAGASVQDGYSPAVTAIRVVPKDGSPDGAAALVRGLRADRPAFPSSVTGGAAFLVDFTHNLRSRMPLALGIMGFATLLLLFLMTGSILVPIKAIVMNLLSLGASFGAIVWVFQDGHFAAALGAEAMGGIEQWIPMLVLVFAFGLSMDYEVFLISRIKELYDEGLPNQRAVVLGVQRTGRIITSAALLIVIVFAGFGAGQMVGIKEMGIALTIAIIVDATVVRCFLVPATMSLLGNANWWAPPGLRRLHDRFGLREGDGAPVAGRLTRTADATRV